MDYKELHAHYYDPSFQYYENWIKEKLIEFKREGRTYFSAEDKIRPILLNKYSSIPPGHQKPFYFEISRIFEDRDDYYSNNSIRKILSNEIKDLYDKNEGLNNKSYELFLPSFAKFQGIYDAYNFYKRITNIVKYYYDRDELHKFKLEPVKHYKEHSQYFDLLQSNISNYDQLDKDQIELNHDGKFCYNGEEKTQEMVDKEFKVNSIIDSPLPILDNDEKLLLIHYLIRAKLLEDIDKMKILALLDTPPIDISIFKEKSRENRQYNIINKGYDYFGKKTGLKLLVSLYDQVEYLKIINLNRALKIDLNKLKQQELE